MAFYGIIFLAECILVTVWFELKPMSTFFFTFSSFFFFFSLQLLTLSTQNSAYVYCLRSYKLYFLETFLLKMSPTILFTHLKIISLQYFQFQFQFSVLLVSSIWSIHFVYALDPLTSIAFAFFFLFFSRFALGKGQLLLFTYCNNTVHTFKNIKNKSHGTIYIFKNYFIIIFLIFNLNKNKLYPNNPFCRFVKARTKKRNKNK